jgi:CTP:molybdopterin cytidylyltransferase MocA
VNGIAALVICGGYGTRLGHALGEARCKSLVPILGSPALARVLEAVKQANCPQCILSIDRENIAGDVERIATASGLAYQLHSDSGQGPTAAAQEASALVNTSRFLVLYGHQIIVPDHLTRMIETGLPFVATTYSDSSEGVRKIARLDGRGYCVSLRHGGEESPAGPDEVYLDKPYILDTQAIRLSAGARSGFDPRTPADADLRRHTILRYAHDLFTIPASFRHEFHYAHELAEVALFAAEFDRRFGGSHWS